MTALPLGVDGAFYINLDGREDRRAEFEEEMRLIGLSCERFAAIKGNPGLVGCGYSHCAVLEEAKRRGYKSVLVFEDDFQFIVSKDTFEQHIESIERDLKGGFDVVMLGYNIQQSESFSHSLVKVKEAQTASAYVVHEGMYDRLIALYKWAMPLLQSTGKHWIYANDQVWKSLQPGTRWYASKVRIGKQRASYSDNAENFVDYGV